ncbi:MAG TPA: hypothetical protein DCL21_01015 [Alphaproteobacteria bacterium]|nr:hypothetical protein [Alphaproteobacteria bacterium]
MAKQKGGPLTKSNRETLLGELRTLFETKEIRHYSVRKLSQKFNIAKDTVSKYLDEIALEFPAKDLEATQLRFKSLFEDALETCESLIHDSKEQGRERDVRDNIKLMIDLIKAETDFMERFFVKDKVADKVDIKGVILNADVPVSDLSTELLKDMS